MQATQTKHNTTEHVRGATETGLQGEVLRLGNFVLIVQKMHIYKTTRI